MKKKEEEQSAKLIRCGMGLVLGGVAALAVCFVFLLVASAAISGGLAGEELMYQLTIVGCVLGAFAGGLLAVRALWEPGADRWPYHRRSALPAAAYQRGALLRNGLSGGGGHRPAVRLPVRRSCRRNPGRRGKKKPARKKRRK